MPLILPAPCLALPLQLSQGSLVVALEGTWSCGPSFKLEEEDPRTPLPKTLEAQSPIPCLPPAPHPQQSLFLQHYLQLLHAELEPYLAAVWVGIGPLLSQHGLLISHYST